MGKFNLIKVSVEEFDRFRKFLEAKKSLRNFKFDVDDNNCICCYLDEKLISKFNYKTGEYFIKKIEVVAVMGKSGSGKSTWISNTYGTEKEKYHIVKSYTTRAIRENDPNDVNTHMFTDMAFYCQSEKLLSYHNKELNYYNWVDKNSFDPLKVNLFAVDASAFNILCEDPRFDVRGVYVKMDKSIRRRLYLQKRGLTAPEDRHLEYDKIHGKNKSKVEIFHNRLGEVN